VRADSGIPGKGYFIFAHDKLDRGVDPSNPLSCRHFWEAEVARIWNHYAPPPTQAAQAAAQDASSLSDPSPAPAHTDSAGNTGSTGSARH
jgi:hypothetical protein